MTTILSIEDSDFERKVIKDMMEEKEYDLLQAKNGEEGIEKYEEENPDLVLLDLRLPDIDGLDVFEELRDIDSAVKVVIVSIVREDETIEKAKDLGAKDYVEKPIDEDELMETVEEVL